MGVFNLIPALPLDGGRIFRAALSLRMPAAKATAISASVARVVALGMGLYGLLSGQLMLALIAGFVWLMAGAEARQARAGGYVGFGRRRPRPAVVFRARESVADPYPDQYVVFGPDGRRIFVGRP